MQTASISTTITLRYKGQHTGMTKRKDDFVGHKVHTILNFDLTTRFFAFADDNTPCKKLEIGLSLTSSTALFPISYKVYSHLRAKYWVVRSGIQYGVDFVAYSYHPSLGHSEYVVLVSEYNSSRNARLLAWPDLQFIPQFALKVVLPRHC
ncbi:hypothetical protein IFM89_009608 [Coptis chinensis]|uniref:tRNA-intron lyase n=1 Tax=Coptis chinensis TaxID=261450 RepID=A0A835INM0_9MAGN|nr:hypothetical protein IFM89_009608 [Coptis chinensis]